MRTIFKYEVPIDDEVHSRLMPRNARIVHVESQTHSPFISARCTFWAEVETEPDETREAFQTHDGQEIRPAEVEGGGVLETRAFRVFGTGQEIPGGVYLGTVLIGPLVFHLYEVKL